MPEPVDTQFPIAITILCYLAVFILIAISLLLYQVNRRLSLLSAKLGKSGRSSKLAEIDEQPQNAEVEPGTPFAKFLKEDPIRLSLSKKEQFKAYRTWRKEKGLNWDLKDKDEKESENAEPGQDEGKKTGKKDEKDTD